MKDLIPVSPDCFHTHDDQNGKERNGNGAIKAGQHFATITITERWQGIVFIIHQNVTGRRIELTTVFAIPTKTDRRGKDPLIRLPSWKVVRNIITTGRIGTETILDDIAEEMKHRRPIRGPATKHMNGTRVIRMLDVHHLRTKLSRNRDNRKFLVDECGMHLLFGSFRSASLSHRFQQTQTWQ